MSEWRYGTPFFIIIILLLSLSLRLFISLYNNWIDFFFVDDAFYYFRIAKNFVSGLGLTYDGHQVTNGFQPLFLLVILPIFFLTKGNLILPLHLVAVFQSIVSIGIGIFLYKISRIFLDKWFSIFIVTVWFFSPIAISQEMNGMETGLNLFLIAVTSYYYLSQIVPSIENIKTRKLILLGVLLSLTVLTRLDGILFMIAVLMHLLYTALKRHQGTTYIKKVQSLFRVVFPVALIPLMVLTPWFIFNYQITGHLLPLSGQAIRFMSLNYGFGAGNFRDQFPLQNIPITYYYENFSFSLMKLLWHHPFTHSPVKFFSDLFHVANMDNFQSFHFISLLILATFVITIALFAFSSLRLIFNQMMFYFLYAFLLLCAFTFYIFGQWFYYRYYFPIYFLMTICGGVVFSLIYTSLKKINNNFGTIFKGGLVALYVLSVSFQIKGFIDMSQDSVHKQFHTLVSVIENVTPANAVIGCFQSGVIGYYSDRQIINLDGKVNREALEAMKSGQLGKYIKKKGITYVADWSFIIHTLFIRNLGDCSEIKAMFPVYKGFFNIYKIKYKSSQNP
jgi:hypothetical protein